MTEKQQALYEKLLVPDPKKFNMQFYKTCIIGVFAPEAFVGYDYKIMTCNVFADLIELDQNVAAELCMSDRNMYFTPVEAAEAFKKACEGTIV